MAVVNSPSLTFASASKSMAIVTQSGLVQQLLLALLHFRNECHDQRCPCVQ
jgi:hypothetical protein